MAEIYRVDDSFDASFFIGSSCAFGVFDGVHCGHRYLLDCAQKTARQSGGRSIALTFDKDPDEVFRADTLKKLMTNHERLVTLSEVGVDAVVVLPFTRTFAAKGPQEFLLHLFDDTPPACLHVGRDFRFGVRASGTVDDLCAWSTKKGTKIYAHHLKSEDGIPISATRIRALLAQGHIEEANKLLGHPYTLCGMPQPGRGQGAEFGFRTANLVIPQQFRALGDGVYAAWVTIGQDRYKAAVNMGVAATFAAWATATCEVHILDFSGDIYGLPIKVEFVRWLRPMRVFASLDELIETVQSNIDWVQKNL